MDEQQENLNEVVQDAAAEDGATNEPDVMPEEAAVQQDERREHSATRTEDATDTVERVAESCGTEWYEQIIARLDGIDQLIAQRLQYDDVKEKVIDRQHAELAELREGLKRDLMRPMLYDLAQTLDDMRKAKESYATQGVDAAVDVIDDIEGMLVYLLEKNDVEQVMSAEGDPFTSKQRMLKTVPTPDAAKAKTVAASVAPGYMWGEEPLFKEKVHVYKFVPSEPADAQLETETTNDAAATPADVQSFGEPQGMTPPSNL
ncbi:nucleotide exchange factor GrpE [Bifidobacterium criceti]|uniref:Nucleotide exchange factor GrpE n=1 Tax=Bifidobacterium criceti TaxID=1960969 RepID=A0A2A2EHL1_9BIFI|nr:nucleotide exchange factor GrpE [Bifidobacterium criceti]PAU68395.1 hypothetical protein B1526_0580 [Bifidobacterium criceti]